MARINSNVPSLIARSNLNRANQDLEIRLERLATGIKINRGADNPAGLIISERLRSEIGGLTQAVDNSERASSVISTTEAALSEISGLLNSIKGLVVEAANTGAVSDEERRANQLQIDSAIDSITRISNTATFGGLQLLNGNLDYLTSGINTSAIRTTKIFSANFAGRTSIDVDVTVIASAQTANLFLSTSTGTFLSTATIEIAGPLGVQVLDVLEGTATSAVVNAINLYKGATGVSASLINPADETSGMRFSTVTHGSAEFVGVRRIGGPPNGGFFQPRKLADNAAVPGTFSFSDAAILAQTTTANYDTGRDVAGLVNGSLAQGKGLRLILQNGQALSVDLLLDTAFATTNGATTNFDVIGGGALYQLGGEISTNQQANIGIQSVAASRLGATLINGAVDYISSLRSGGNNDLNSRRFAEASRVLESAIDEISSLRGRLGAFERNTLQTNVRSLTVAIENLTASESRIRDADFAAETSALTRAQVLASTSTSVLALANQNAQSVLQLLG